MCLILGLLASKFVTPVTMASDQAKPASLGEKVASSLEARTRADKYSFATGGIGIVMSYGTKNSVKPQDVGDAFIKEFEKRGEKARYFFYNTDRDGMAMEFYVGYSAFGPWDVDKAASNVSKVVARAQAARRVHGNK